MRRAPDHEARGVAPRARSWAGRRPSIRRALTSVALVVATLGAAMVDATPIAEASCGSGALDAPDLNALFGAAGLGATAHQEGFGGGDYPHAFPLPDGRILWMFQDMHFSNDNTLGATNAVHNGAIVQHGRCWTIMGSRGADFIGDALTIDSARWFWPLDAEVGSDGNLWVFMAEMANPNGNGAAIGVRPVATWRAVLDPTTLAQIDFGPARNSSASLYGQQIVSTDQWTYLYGNCYRQFVAAPTGPSEFDPCMRDTRVARVPLRQLDAVPEYWNGSTWTSNAAAATPITSRAGATASLMNVQWFGDTFVNVTKVDEWWGAEIVIERSDRAIGPWTQVDEIFIVGDRKCNACGIYGAFLMPWLDSNGDMTIAVAHGTDFNSWRANGFLYRPTFYARPVPDASTPLAAANSPAFDVGDQRSGFEAVDPERLLDTREADSPFGRLEPGGVFELDLTDRMPNGAVAAVLNLAATRTDDGGFIRAFPCNSPEPTASALNPIGGAALSNAAIVPLGDGRVCFTSWLSADLIVDLNGWMSTNSDVGLTPTTPRRLLDTRTGDAGGRLAAGRTIEVNVAPADGNQTAVSLNITAVRPTGNGFVTAWPCGTDRPLVANLNTAAGVTRPNQANVRVGDGGNVCLYTSGATDLTVDLMGEYSPDATSTYTPIGPVRVLDTRADGPRPHSSNLAELVPLGDLAGAQINITATRTTRPGYLTAYACLTDPWPGTANANYVAGDTSTNLALVTPSAGYGCIYSSSSTQTVADLYGVWRSD